MVLVDTSVWIRYFAKREPYLTGLGRLLAQDQVAGHELVYGEIFIGDRGGRSKLLVAYERMRQVRLVPHQYVVALVRGHRLHGRGAGWIDIHLLASARVAGMPFWTADPRLHILAEELGVAYEI